MEFLAPQGGLQVEQLAMLWKEPLEGTLLGLGMTSLLEQQI